MNKRLICLICFVVIGLTGQSGMCVTDAQEPYSSRVKIRAVRYPDYVRIVFTADDPLARKASVILTKNKTIKIDFRQAGATDAYDRGNPSISFETAKGSVDNDIPVEIVKSVNLIAKGGSCLITLPNVEDIKVLRLQSPSRIVIDALFTAASKDNVAGTVTKSVADQIAFKYVVIDAGHGGYDYGIRGAKFAEKDFVLAFAKELSAILAKSGKEVVLTRKSDQIMSVSERAVIVNRRQPDILISLHVSSTKTPAVYSIPERPDSAEPAAVQSSEQKKREMARASAEAMAKNIEKEFSISVARESIPLSLLVRSKAPSVLIELPNPDDFSYEKKGRERLLSAILKGLAAVAKEEKQPLAVPKPDIRPDIKNEIKNGSNTEKL